MAKRTIIISDITGDDIPEADKITLIVQEHPAIDKPVKLDAANGELDELRKYQAEFTVIEIVDEAGERERLVVDVETFNGIFADKASEVLADAEPVTVPRQRRASSEEKIDYKTLEHAGTPHRGTITDAEAKIVRENLEEVNKRLAAAGQRTIDPSDAKMIERYGFTAK
jgi:hypothetical protein